jgi:hypothetical protein
MNSKSILRSVGVVAALAVSLAAQAQERPPESNGVISNPTLVKNQDVAKAQAAGVITTFMNQGAKSCDDDGKNCHSLFGEDDTPDYQTLQNSGQSLTGISSFAFMSGGGDDGGDSNAVASQTGTLALACGDAAVKKIAGIVVKFSDCVVNANGDTRITVRMCSGPARTNPVTPPANEVVCSDDPAAANFRPPSGFVCKRPACDTEPVGSLNGWSQPQTISWQAKLPESASEDQKSKNGLGLIFYPPLSGGQIASFTADSDNLTAVKIVQSFVNTETRRTAVGLKVAYRHKTQVTKEMMVQGPSSVPNPSANTAQWDTILKLQGNEKIPQFQQQYAANGTECLQQIGNGIGTDGKITVCDPNYTNESGIKPLAMTAQVAAEGQDCGTTPQCLTKVVNTKTWTESCSAEVPMAMRSCSTKQDYTVENVSYVRTRTSEMCHENRKQVEQTCATSVNPSDVLVVARCQPGTWINKNVQNDEFAAPSVDRMLARYYCDNTSADNGQPLKLQVTAYGSDGDCGSGWKSFEVDFSRLTHVEEATAISPHWQGYCNWDMRVDADVTRPCNPIDTHCAATLTFYHKVPANVGTPDANGNCPANSVFVPRVWFQPAYCRGWAKNVTAKVPMDFIRPGMDVTYTPPVNTCTAWEAAK